MASTPLPNGSSGDARNSAGRFAPGNPGGPGNPYARRVAALRSMLLDAATADDLRSMVRSLLKKAKAGDVAAARLVLAYTIGPPLAATEPDRLDEHEYEVERGRPTDVSRELLSNRT